MANGGQRLDDRRAEVALPFCTHCGEPIPAGGTHAHQTETTRRVSAARWAARLVLGVVIIALAATLALVERQVRSLRASDRAAAARLTAGLGAGQQIINGLNRRVSAVEGRLNSQPDPAAVARQVSASVFTIETDAGQGSGFAVEGTTPAVALIVTNFHVVSDTWDNGGRTVTLRRGDASWVGTITQVDPGDDLALIRGNLSVAPLKEASHAALVGDPVLVIGTPLGIGESVTSGIVSGFPSEQGQRFIQFSAPISPGNSGGPVVNYRGEVVGVTEAKAVGGGAEGLSFGVPVDELCSGMRTCS